MNESRILRDRLQAVQEALDSLTSANPPYGSAAILVQTKTLTTYPSAATAFFAASPVQLNGDETEGATAIPVVDTATTLYVTPNGGAVPAVGSYAVALAIGG